MLWRVILILLMAGFTGCTLFAPEPPPEPPLTPPVVEPVVAPVVTPKQSPAAGEVALIVSSDIPAYREVAEAVASRLHGRSKSWYLKGSGDELNNVLEEIARSERSQVVAVGLDAAVASKRLKGKQVIFCQVFNYEDDRLLSATSKGVGMMPSYEKTFSAWRAVSPGIKAIAILTGPGLREQVRTASLAAKKVGITVSHLEVNSDKEFLLVYKNIVNNVQGYWLWPDNRILSGGVLREVMTFSVRNGKEVLVFNDELLALGGLISATSDSRDIASQVVERLVRAEGKNTIPGVAIEPLDAVNLQINPVMAKRFGLEIPEQYRKYIHGP